MHSTHLEEIRGAGKARPGELLPEMTLETSSVEAGATEAPLVQMRES